MALPKFGGGDATLFATKRTGREAIVIEPKTLAQVTDLMVRHGIVQGETFYTASQAETDVYNGQRETSAKNDKREVPAAINRAAMAAKKALKDANTVRPYVAEAIRLAIKPTKDDGSDSPLFGKVPSVRTVDKGTEDNPQVLWAIVLANPRVRASK